MDLEHKAFERLRLGEQMSKKYYGRPLLLCYSGGKDSDVLIQLAINSGIDFEILHNHTTADAPETVRYIRERFAEWENKGIKCTIEYPVYKGEPTSMWKLIPQKMMPPTRLIRYCCSILKEKGGRNRAIATGVRWAESVARSKRGIYEDINRDKNKKIILNNDNDDRRLLVERCEKQARIVVNPIIDWQESDIWEYLKENKTPCNPLYCEGYKRVGCIGCPMAGKHRYEEFRDYPKYKDMYIHAFDRMLEVKKAKGRTDNMTWQDGYDVFRWWMEEDFTQFELMDDELWE